MTTIAPVAGGPLTAAAASPAERVIRVGDLDTFYLDSPGGAPTVLMLHGLSANANSFTAIMASGLSPACRAIAPDLRGRARSGKPASGYGMADHGRDVIGLLDALGLERVVIAGHSFGGYLGIWLAAHHPHRVEKLVVIDAAISSHPRVGVLLKPSLDRLTRVTASTEAYLDQMRRAEFLADAWDAHMEAFYRCEVTEQADGTARAATSADAIGQAVVGLAVEPWLHLVQSVSHPTLVLNALDDFGAPGAMPLIDAVTARATARAFPNGNYEVVPGNHLTMVFGEGARAIAGAIGRFVHAGDGAS